VVDSCIARNSVLEFRIDDHHVVAIEIDHKAVPSSPFEKCADDTAPRGKPQNLRSVCTGTT
jgi:hypothetical protein